jgi:hypothetical protein
MNDQQWFKKRSEIVSCQAMRTSGQKEITNCEIFALKDQFNKSAEIA